MPHFLTHLLPFPLPPSLCGLQYPYFLQIILSNNACQKPLEQVKNQREIFIGNMSHQGHWKCRLAVFLVRAICKDPRGADHRMKEPHISRYYLLWYTRETIFTEYSYWVVWDLISVWGTCPSFPLLPGAGKLQWLLLWKIVFSVCR